MINKNISYDKIPYLDTTKLDDNLWESLTKRCRELVMCMTGSSGYHHYKSTANEISALFDIESIISVQQFFVSSEMFEFASYMDKIIEIKTLNNLNSILNTIEK